MQDAASPDLNPIIDKQFGAATPVFEMPSTHEPIKVPPLRYGTLRAGYADLDSLSVAGTLHPEKANCAFPASSTKTRRHDAIVQDSRPK